MLVIFLFLYIMKHIHICTMITDNPNIIKVYFANNFKSETSILKYFLKGLFPTFLNFGLKRNPCNIQKIASYKKVSLASKGF